MSGSASARMRVNSNDEFEKHLLREMEKLSNLKKIGGLRSGNESDELEEITPNF